MPGVSLDNFSEWSSKLVKHIVILGLFREFMMLAVWFCIAEVLRVKIILEENLGNKKKIFKNFWERDFRSNETLSHTKKE